MATPLDRHIMASAAVSNGHEEGASPTDREALVALFKAANGRSWLNKKGWDTWADLKDWHGVAVNDQGRVVKVRLPNNNMQGTIPKELGNLGALRELHLAYNLLSGSIPRELGNLSQLAVLLLGVNALTGSVPAEIGKLYKLKLLGLGTNSLTGSIPKELGNLVAAHDIHLDTNKLTGPIPKELGGLKQLTVLWLGGNKLDGSIPAELGNLVKLERLKLSTNCLKGHIPPELGNLVAVQVLYLDDNNLDGPIPKELGGLRQLTVLWLGPNKLDGFIPAELGKLVKLQRLNLGTNCLEGNVPPELGDLAELQQLYLDHNNLNGVLSPAFGRLRQLTTFHVHQNNLEGTVPSELGFLDKLESLSFTDNNFTEVPLDFLRAIQMRPMAAATLDVSANPLLRPPPTVMVMGVDEAIAWWEDIRRFGESTSNKLKMVLVGLAEAGKTTVVRNITGRPTPNKLDRTVGIEITEDWQPVGGGPLKISIWDFAGQADYYASHQIFLTEGSLFLLVVDLHALFLDGTSGVTQEGDPRGCVYRWLEMLHLRVPGAAVALVGTHTDAAEFKDPAKLEVAVFRLEQLIARYLSDKQAEAASIEASLGREVVFDCQFPFDRAPSLPIIHPKVFRTSLDPTSASELVEWVQKASRLLDCPPGFHFPAVGAKLPTAWIDANLAMDGLKAKRSGKRYVSWREAVGTFDSVMETKGTPISDPEEVLLRAMRHREAEGGVLLSLTDGPADGEGGLVGMLYLDPTWLIEVIRRLTDHNLVDPGRQGTLKNELEGYGKQNNPRLDVDTLWAQHRSYRASGTLGTAYLRFLWLHRQLDKDDLRLQLSLDEFNSVLRTLEALLVLYRAPSTGGTNPVLYVVPARLPEYGDEQVLEKGNMALGDIVVRTRCSFRRSYAPPGIIGRFLAFSNAHIMEARECWQHGAHLIWTPGAHDVLVYETHTVENNSDSGSVAYPGLVLCVKGNTPAVREVLDNLTAQVKELLQSKVQGYPVLCPVMFEDTDVIHVSEITSDLRKYLDNRFDQLGTTIGKVAGVSSKVLQAFYLAAGEENRYPRLLILKPETDPQPKVEDRESPTPRLSPTVCEAVEEEEAKRGAAAHGMQRETWNTWIKAFTEGRTVRMVFICEHDMTEVTCGPDGKGYVIKDLPTWAKGCIPLLQVSLFALRVAVGMVSHVDLPLNDLLGAVVKSASTEVLDGLGTGLPVSCLTGAAPLRDGSIRDDQQLPPERLQKEGYLALCQFMQRVESPSTTCCGSRFQCSSCGSTQSRDCVCVGWESEMVRVSNGKGGLVWVKRTNEAEYIAKIAREAELPKTGPHA